jgi:hypothetical protein
VNQVRSVTLFVKSVTKITFIREYGNINRFTYDYGHNFYVREQRHDIYIFVTATVFLLVNVVVPTVILFVT